MLGDLTGVRFIILWTDRHYRESKHWTSVTIDVDPSRTLQLIFEPLFSLAEPAISAQPDFSFVGSHIILQP